MQKFTHAKKAYLWSQMIKENIAFIHERELTKRWNILILEIGSIVLLIILIVKGVIIWA